MQAGILMGLFVSLAVAILLFVGLMVVCKVQYGTWLP